jgi:hypothetical protein
LTVTAPTLYFVHGTGVRDVSGSVAAIRERAERLLGWGPEQVKPILWGTAVGPKDLDLAPVLPPQVGTRSLTEPEEVNAAAALWEVLLADPGAELRALSEASATPGLQDQLNIGDPALAPPGAAAQNALLALVVAPEAISAAGVTQAQIQAAAGELAQSGLVAKAGARSRDSAGSLVDAAARAVVAITLCNAPQAGTEALYDAAARDGLVRAVADAIDPDAERGLKELGKSLLARLGTRIAVTKRAQFMEPLGDFIRDVAFYLQHGEKIRDYIAGELGQHDTDGPVVLLGHSLGGIACVDLLAASTAARPSALRVDLLMTVGSQAPLLYLLDSLHSLSPTTPNNPPPFQPWLNIYNVNDLLSFCAKRVFTGSDTHIVDEPVDAGVPFPMAHSAYWNVDRVYELLREHLTR